MHTSPTTSNAEIARNPHAPYEFRAARGHLLRWRSPPIYRHRLCRTALHLPPRRPERGPS